MRTFRARARPTIAIVALALLSAGGLVAGMPQTIVFDAIPNQFRQGSPFPIVAQASSGLAVTITSQTPAVCKVAFALVTLAGTGTCTIRATQGGNGTYNAATPVNRSFTVSQATAGTKLITAPGNPFGPGFSVMAPYFMATGDFNGDGIPDLVTVNNPNNSISIFLGNGGGGFTATAASPIAVGSSPIYAAVGDFDGDGVQDIAIANTSDITITVLRGLGTGAFTPFAGSPFDSEAGSNGPLSVSVGDFNGDGIQDLVVGNSDATLSVFLGNGSGGFTLHSSPTVGNQPGSIAVGDFNGDGIEDLAVANQNDNTVTIL